MELRKKGISDEIISSVLEPIDETKLAFKAARKKARRYRELEYPDFRKKMSGFLARRGFHYGIISEVLPKIWEEIASQNE
jgi:regulatory protein